jgi:Saxitoxin biosynthesis operon protein SxtJ
LVGSKRGGPSDRRFGFLIGLGLAAVAIRGYFHSWSVGAVVGVLALGASFLLFAWLAPRRLAPLTAGWMRFGEILGRFVSPIVLGVIFFGIITPVAAATRMFGRDELRLKRTTEKTYWIDRRPAGPAGASFKNQF